MNLVDEKIMTEEDGIYTIGGAYAFLNLVLHLIKKIVGREVAVIASKAFSIDIERDSQSAFIIFEVQKDHGYDKVIRAQKYIEDHDKETIRWMIWRTCLLTAEETCKPVQKSNIQYRNGICPAC